MTAAAAAIIVAAGSGERMGAAIPKAFLTLAGRPLLWWPLRAFAEAGVAEVVVVTVEERRAEALGLARGAGLDRAAVCTGGRTRSESVERGLERLPDAGGLVAVHDAARPLVSAGLVGRTLAALEDPWAAVAPALPVVDTLKLVDGERVVRTVSRRALWAVQTPQVFSRLTLERVHDRPATSEATDDLALVEGTGGQVRLIEGERRNFKITYPEDLTMAQALVAART